MMPQHRCAKVRFSMAYSFSWHSVYVRSSWLKFPANSIVLWLKHVGKVLALSSCSWSQVCPVAFVTLSGVSERGQLGRRGGCKARNGKCHLLMPSFFGITLGTGFLLERDEKSVSAILLTSSVLFLHYETKQEAKWQPGTSWGLCSHHTENAQALNGQVPSVPPRLHWSPPLYRV